MWKKEDITQGTEAVNIPIKGRWYHGKFLWFVMPLKSKQSRYNFIVSLCGNFFFFFCRMEHLVVIKLCSWEVKSKFTDASVGWSAYSFIHKPCGAAFSQPGDVSFLYAPAGSWWEEQALGFSFLDKEESWAWTWLRSAQWGWLGSVAGNPPLISPLLV